MTREKRYAIRPWVYEYDLYKNPSCYRYIALEALPVLVSPDMRHLRLLYVLVRRVLEVRTSDAYRSNLKFAELTKVLVLELEMSPFESRRNNVKISTKGTRGRAFRTLGILIL
jgi:hypothetical protein